MIDFNAIVLLGREPGTVSKAALGADQRFVELRMEDAARISEADRAYGRRGDLARIKRRFDHGLRYFAIEEPRGLIGWFWVAHDCPRYLDELCWKFDLDATHAWARDAFMAPDRRGRRLLSVLMDTAARVDDRPARYLSDVSMSNVISLRAHKALGFERLATVRALAIGSRLVLRSLPPSNLLAPVALRTSRRVLWMSREELAWHQDNIA